MTAQRICKCGQPARPNRRMCGVCGEKAVAYNRRARTARIAKGLCGWTGCKQQFVPGKTMCTDHLEYIRTRNLQRQRERLAAGLCVQCGKPSEFGQARCLVHRKVKGTGNGLPLPARKALAEYRLQQLAVVQQQAAQAIHTFIARHLHLIPSERTRRILQLRYGEQLTLEQTGAQLGITRERVRQLQQAAEDRILMFTIEKDVPIPVRGHGQSAQIRETLAAMEVGDSFVVPNKVHETAEVARMAKALGMVVTSRKISDTERRVWLVSKTREEIKLAS